MKQERTVTEVQENLLEGQIKAFKKQMDNMYDLNLRLMQWIDDCRMFLAENGILREFEQNYGTYESRIENTYNDLMQKEEMELNCYRNYGVLGREKEIVYSFSNPIATADSSEKITFLMPEGWEISSAAGDYPEEVIYSPWGTGYTPDELMVSQKDELYFAGIDGDGNYFKIQLKGQVEKNEDKDVKKSNRDEISPEQKQENMKKSSKVLRI